VSGIRSLIVTNVRRNLARSMLTVIGMGLAALIMTASLTLSQGYPATAYGPYRDYCGGDVLVFADKLWVRAPDVNRAEPGTWHVQLAQVDLPGPWRFFQPALATRGAILPRDSRRAFLRQDQLDQLVNAIARMAGVTAVRPYFTLPTTQVLFAPPTPQLAPGVDPGSAQPRAPLGWFDSYIRAWRGGVWPGLDGYIVAGRSLALADEGELVCLVDADRAKLGQAGAPFPSAVPAVGSVVRVALPRVTASAEGQLRVDHTQPLVAELRVVGHYSVPSRVATWTNTAAGGDTGSAPPETEQLYLTSPEIIVPWETTAALLARMSGGVVDSWTTALAVELDGLAYVESFVGKVNAAYPELCAASVPRLAGVANARWLPEPAYRVPASEWAGAQPSGQLSEAVAISQAFNVIFFAVAALLAAANGIVLVLERQREIGILKALGAYGRDVILMILGEIVLLSTIGAFGGFVLAEGMAAWNLISNRAGLWAIVSTVGFDLVRVLGLTVAFAAVFGLAPAMRTTRMTAMEVLRRE
jgi:hypothetical protein